MSEPLRNIEQAAAWLGIPKKTLQNMVTARSVPFSWVGRHARFSQAHLDAIVAAGEELPITAPARLQVVGLRGDATGPRPPAGPKPQSPPRQPPPRRQPPPPPKPPRKSAELRAG